MTDAHHQENAHVEGHGSDDPNEPVHAHIAPWQLYFKIFGALIAMTLITVAVANIDLGSANLAIAIMVATIKASLVVTFFMHLKDDRRFNALLFLGSLLFGGVFLAYTLNDTAYRGAVDGISGMRQDYRTGEWAPGTSPDRAKGDIVVPPLAPGAASGGHH